LRRTACTAHRYNRCTSMVNLQRQRHVRRTSSTSGAAAAADGVNRVRGHRGRGYATGQPARTQPAARMPREGRRYVATGVFNIERDEQQVLAGHLLSSGTVDVVAIELPDDSKHSRAFVPDHALITRPNSKSLRLPCKQSGPALQQPSLPQCPAGVGAIQVFASAEPASPFTYQVAHGLLSWRDHSGPPST
jgi:hypothetical protein